MPATAPQSETKRWTPPHALRGDVIVVEDPPRSGRFVFGQARLCIDGDLITYTAVGTPDLPQHWQHRHTGQRFSIVYSGEPADQEQHARRIAFRDQAGAIKESMRAGAVAEIIDAHKPL